MLCKVTAAHELTCVTSFNYKEGGPTNIVGTLSEDGQSISFEDGNTWTKSDEPLDFAKAWDESSNYVDLQKQLEQAAESPDEALEIKYDSEFAVKWYRRDNLMAKRLVTIYWRSPAYNLSRMVSAYVLSWDCHFHPPRGVTY